MPVAFSVVVDRAVGYAPVEADWDTYIKDNMNSGVWVQLANSTLAVDTASIDFQSISGSWAHLMLVAYLRCSGAGLTITTTSLRFNNDSGANYDRQRLYGNAAGAIATESFAQTSAYFGSIPGATADPNVFAAYTLFIPHYANASNNKAFLSSCAVKGSASAGLLLSESIAGFWRSNSAITRITLIPFSGNLVAGSRATLYGLP